MTGIVVPPCSDLPGCDPGDEDGPGRHDPACAHAAVAEAREYAQRLVSRMDACPAYRHALPLPMPEWITPMHGYDAEGQPT